MSNLGERVGELEGVVSELRDLVMIHAQKTAPNASIEWLNGKTYEAILDKSSGEVIIYDRGGDPIDWQTTEDPEHRVTAWNWWNNVDLPIDQDVYLVQRPWGWEILMSATEGGVAYGALDEDLLSGSSASVDVYLNNSDTGDNVTIYDRNFIPAGFKLPVGALVTYLRHYAEDAFILITSDTCPVAQ